MWNFLDRDVLKESRVSHRVLTEGKRTALAHVERRDDACFIAGRLLADYEATLRE